MHQAYVEQLVVISQYFIGAVNAAVVVIAFKGQVDAVVGREPVVTLIVAQHAGQGIVPVNKRKIFLDAVAQVIEHLVVAVFAAIVVRQYFFFLFGSNGKGIVLQRFVFVVKLSVQRLVQEAHAGLTGNELVNRPEAESEGKRPERFFGHQAAFFFYGPAVSVFVELRAIIRTAPGQCKDAGNEYRRCCFQLPLCFRLM